MDEASIRSVAINLVSNAASNALSVANAASAGVNVVSNALSVEIADRISEDNALSAAINVVSNALSTEAVAFSSRVNSVNAALSAVSARSVGNVSTHGIQSVIDALSNRISAGGGTASVTSQELSVVAAALSGRIDTASALASIADLHASTASLAATSVDGRVTSVNAALSAISVRSIGDVSTHGLQSVIDAISNRISVVSAVNAPKYISIQNLAASALSLGCPVYIFTSAFGVKKADASPIGVANNVVGLVADDSIAVSAFGRIQVEGLLSLTSAQIRDVTGGDSAIVVGTDYKLFTTSGQITPATITGNIASVLVGYGIQERILLLKIGPPESQDIVIKVDNLSIKVSIQSIQISAISAAVTSLNNRVTSLNTFLSGISSRSVGNISTHGLQSVIDALSNRISAGGGTASVTSQELSVEAAALSGRIDTASALASTADAHASTASAAATSADTHANTASAAATSVDGRVNSVNTFLSGISARSVGGVSTHGIQSVINALSNRISAIPGGGSTNAYSYVSAGQAICANAFTDISGLCVSVSAGGIYKLEGQVMFSCSAATGNSFTLVFPTMSVAAGQLRTPFLNPVPGTSVGYSAIAWGNFGTAGSGSALISANFAAGALFDLIIDGVMNVNTTGVIKVQARGSVATNTITITPGSYLKVFKIR